ncbi:MAG: hypothetical protein QCH99_04705 [Candidatus Bathyarchaeota archaeon]|nr:hypothetical protein [Candidatus Bathyarchaeum tardum]
MVIETPVYSKRMVNLKDTLSVLSSNEEVYQSKIPQLVGCNYRTTIRQLQLLENLGLAKIVRTEPTGKQGRAHNVWQITFKGLLLSLSLNPENIDEIARMHSQKWIVFSEWEALTEDPEIKQFLKNQISLTSSDFQIKWNNLSNKEAIKSHGIFIKENPDIERTFEVFRLTKATLTSLGLDMIFTYKAYPPYINNENHVIIKHWKNCWKNPRIRTFMEEQFTLEKVKHECLLLFENHFRSYQ